MTSTSRLRTPTRPRSSDSTSATRREGRSIRRAWCSTGSRSTSCHSQRQFEPFRGAPKWAPLVVQKQRPYYGLVTRRILALAVLFQLLLTDLALAQAGGGSSSFGGGGGGGGGGFSGG